MAGVDSILLYKYVHFLHDAVFCESLRLHYNSDMVIHVLGDVPQEASSDDADASKCDAHVVYPLVSLCVRDLASENDCLVRTRNVFDAFDLFNSWQQRRTRELDDFSDKRRRGDVKLGNHGSAYVVLGQRDKLGNEDVIVDAVADAASDNTNGESESCDCGDEVVWADDRGYNPRQYTDTLFSQ